MGLDLILFSGAALLRERRASDSTLPPLEASLFSQVNGLRLPAFSQSPNSFTNAANHGHPGTLIAALRVRDSVACSGRFLTAFTEPTNSERTLDRGPARMTRITGGG